ncbi:MAG: ABC transporter ATP-binding protein [Propionibacteriaceae bacterium]|nr:ABC transporter ATP-binding protein [Propionibacteriaceae bacterium]
MIKDVDLSLRAGVVSALLGPNGSGKTTLIKIMLGLLTPDKGAVSLDGESIDRLGQGFCRQVGVVFEGVDNTYGFMNGWDNLYYLGSLSGCSRRTVRTRCLPYLDRLGLMDDLGKQSALWSLGMRQKLAVVAALTSMPRFLFLDEPTLGLDVEAKVQVMAFVRQLCAEEGTACLLTSHQSDVVETMADEIALLGDGRIVFGGSLPAFRETFGESSAIVQFVDSNLGRSAVANLMSGVDGFDQPLEERGLAVLAHPGDLPAIIEQLQRFGSLEAIELIKTHDDDLERLLQKQFHEPKLSSVAESGLGRAS